MRKVVYIKENEVEIADERSIIVLQKTLFNFEPRINDEVEFIRDEEGKIIRVTLAEKKASSVPKPSQELENAALFGIFSIVSSILGFFIFPLIGSIVGIVLGIIGLNTPNNDKDRTLSIVGIILGIAGILLFIFLIVLIVALTMNTTTV
ncbi:MAG: DUF4190 domain-containing protein [Bacillota bacterium]|jgi:hypothetical protein|nr:DUF4190 domain-containing protein [Bacillota bacterium]